MRAPGAIEKTSGILLGARSGGSEDDRQVEIKIATCAHGARHSDSSTMGGDDRLDDGQAEARTAAIRGIGLPETIENSFEFSRGNRGPGIAKT